MTAAGDPPFYTFLREERQFSFLLAHFLMQRGGALARFIELVNSRLDAGKHISSARLDDAEVYVEYAYLRDRWDSFLTDEKHAGKRVTKEVRDRANAKKKEFIGELFRRVESLAGLTTRLHVDIPELNRLFIGPRGTRILRDVASPAHWSVATMAVEFKSQPEVFRDLCRLKWSFHIKPDLVVMLPGERLLCVEAKLESGEATYPVGNETAPYDLVAGPNTRVRQFDLQQFMFQKLLGQPCQPVVVQRAPRVLPDGSFPTDPMALTWTDVLRAVADEGRLGQSIPFVTRLIAKNRTLKGSKAD